MSPLSFVALSLCDGADPTGTGLPPLETQEDAPAPPPDATVAAWYEAQLRWHQPRTLLRFVLRWNVLVTGAMQGVDPCAAGGQGGPVATAATFQPPAWVDTVPASELQAHLDFAVCDLWHLLDDWAGLPGGSSAEAWYRHALEMLGTALS